MQVGFLSALFYVFSIVISTLWIQSLGKDFSVYFLLVSSSFFAMIVFNVFNFKQIIVTHKLIVLDTKNWALMSLYLTLVWFFTYLGAAQNALILLTVAFLANALFASINHRSALKFFINLLIIIAIYWANKDTVGVFWSTFYGLLTGLFSFLYFKKSSDFAKEHNISAIQVLSIRFYFLFLLALIMLLWSVPSGTSVFSWYALLLLLCLAVFNQILPNFFSQTSVQHLGPERFSFFASLAPFLTFLFNGVMYHQWSINMCLLTFLATLSLNFDVFSGLLKQKYTSLE